MRRHPDDAGPPGRPEYMRSCDGHLVSLVARVGSGSRGERRCWSARPSASKTAASDRTATQIPARPRPPPPRPPPPAIIGTIDIGAVFKGYDKVKVLGEEFQAAALVKKNELMKFMTEMQQETEASRS